MNIFGDTRYESTKEDILTNAFLSVLEKSEPDMLTGFLALLGIRAKDLHSIALENHVGYKDFKSIPDGYIGNRSFTVIIESKRYQNISSEQLIKYIDCIKTNEKAPVKILLVISADYKKPSFIDNISTPEIKVSFMSWYEIFGFIKSYESKDPVTRLLSDEFCEYLEQHGYCYVSESLRKIALTEISKRFDISPENLGRTFREITTAYRTKYASSPKWKEYIYHDRLYPHWGLIFHFGYESPVIIMGLFCSLIIDDKPPFIKGWIGLERVDGHGGGKQTSRRSFVMLKTRGIDGYSVRGRKYGRMMSLPEIENIMAGKYDNLIDELNFLLKKQDEVRNLLKL